MVGVPVAIVALLGIQVGVVLADDYLVNANFVVDETVYPPATEENADTGDVFRPRAEGGVFRLWVLGDSTAAGVGAPDEASSLPVQIARRVARGSGRVVHVTGLGVSGARTHDVVARQVPLLPENNVDAVVIVIGSNDVTHVTPPWNFADRTTQMVTSALQRTDAPVIVGGVPRFSGATALPQPLRAIADRFSHTLRTRQESGAQVIDGVTYVDIASLASPRFIGRPEAMSLDDFHPSEVGYSFWADALAPPVTMIARGAR